MPAYVDADLRVSGHSHQGDTSDDNELVFSIPVGGDGCGLEPGPRKAIKVRLDHGPLGHHWVNEFVNAHSLIISFPIDTLFSRSQALVDADGTLHALLDVRLSQYIPPVAPASPDQSDAWSQVSSPVGTLASSSTSDTPRPPAATLPSFFGKNKRNQKANDPNKPEKPKPVYTSLRRGGR
jgi:hypothetical protein